MERIVKTDQKNNSPIISVCRVLGFILVLVLVLIPVFNTLSWKDTSGDYISSTDQLYATDDNLIDAVFVGTSHVYQGIYPSVLWNEYGYSAFDMAISGQDRHSAYHSLVELLKTQSPEVVFVDVYSLLYNGYKIEGNLYRNSMALKPSVNSYKLIKDIVEPDNVMDHIFRLPIVHTRYQELQKYDFIENPVSSNARGEVYFNSVWDISATAFVNPYTTEIGSLNEEQLEWLDSFRELSASNNFRLVFFIAPLDMTDKNQEIINAASEYAAQHSLTFIDCNILHEEIGINPATDFTDYSHLNYLGAHKLTRYLGSWINQNLTLADHRGDSKYYLWSNDAHLYNNTMNKYSLEASDSIEDILQLAASNSDFVTVLSIESKNVELTEEYSSALSSIGISDEDFANGGMWLCQNGVYTKILDNNAKSDQVLINFTDSDVMRLHYDAYLSPTNISIGSTTYNNYGYTLTVLVYDTFLERVIYNGGK